MNETNPIQPPGNDGAPPVPAAPTVPRRANPVRAALDRCGSALRQLVPWLVWCSPFRIEKGYVFGLINVLIATAGAAGGLIMTTTNFNSGVWFMRVAWLYYLVSVVVWVLLLSHWVGLRKLLLKVGVVGIENPSRPVSDGSDSRRDVIRKGVQRWSFFGATGVNVFTENEDRFARQDLNIDIEFYSLHENAIASIHQVHELQNERRDTGGDIRRTYDRIKAVDEHRKSHPSGRRGRSIDTSPLLHFPFFRTVQVDGKIYVRGYTVENTPYAEHLVVESPDEGPPSFLHEMFTRYISHEVTQSKYERMALVSMFVLSREPDAVYHYETLKEVGDRLGIELPGVEEHGVGYQAQFEGFRTLVRNMQEGPAPP